MPRLTKEQIQAAEKKAAQMTPEDLERLMESEADPALLPEAGAALRAETDYQLRRMRAQHEARRILRCEERPEIPTFKSLAAFLAEPDEETRYRIDGLWPSGGNVLLAAQYKAGKTTMVHNLVRSLADGTPFLGMFETSPVSGSVVVLDFEMPEGEARRWLRDVGIERTEAVMYVSMRGKAAAFDPTDAACRREWADLLRPAGCEVLVVDCLAPIASALGLDVDSNADMGPVVDGLTALATAAGGSEVFLIHHMGHKNERSRGAVRLMEWPDALWKIARPGEDPAGARYFSAFGRSVDVPEGSLVLDGQTRRLSLVEGGRRSQQGAASLNGVDNYVQQLVRAGAPRNLGRDRLKVWADRNGIELPGKTSLLSQIARAVKERQESERLPGFE